jgi:hypothetical protein
MLLLLAFPGAQNVPIEVTPSLAVTGFAFGLSMLTGILFGVAPAWISAQARPADALRGGTRTTSSATSLLQRTLVVLQAALSLVLLIGAGLFAQSLSKLQNTDLKLDAHNRYVAHINPQAAGCEDRAHRLLSFRKLRRLRGTRRNELRSQQNTRASLRRVHLRPRLPLLLFS